jgi:hypothetical protein
MHAKEWDVQLHITEDDSDTSARAILTRHDELNVERVHLEGIGRSRRNPADRPVPAIGDELAVARALADLAAKLTRVAATDVAQAAGRPS